jgi:peroxiredoxin Q/BCP
MLLCLCPLANKPLTKEKNITNEQQNKEDSIKSLDVGDHLPKIQLQNQLGAPVDVASLAKDSGIVIFFVPKAATLDCTEQACLFRDEYQNFQDKGYKIFGCSGDSPKSLLSWQTKHNFKYDLLSDTKYELIGPLGYIYF